MVWSVSTTPMVFRRDMPWSKHFLKGPDLAAGLCDRMWQRHLFPMHAEGVIYDVWKGPRMGFLFQHFNALHIFLVFICCLWESQTRCGLPKRYGLPFPLKKRGGCTSAAWLRMTAQSLKKWFRALANADADATATPPVTTGDHLWPPVTCEVFRFDRQAAWSKCRAPKRVDPQDFAHNWKGFLRQCGSALNGARLLIFTACPYRFAEGVF